LIPDWSNRLCFLGSVPTGFATYTVSYALVTVKRELFVEINSRRVKLTVHLHLVPRVRMRGVICPSPRRPRGLVLNQAWEDL
jgi:hypothetical protein